jgi:ribosomal protein S12 methylthiotransferase accessory factor
MNRLWAVASGYGELMERIQNRLFVFQALKYFTPLFIQKNNELNTLQKLKTKHNIQINYRFHPDEKNYIIEGREKMYQHFGQYFPRTAKYNSIEHLDDEPYNLINLPFRNINTNTVVDLPYYLILMSVSSTGMCAGNTDAEAITQGINEIFERYILQLIFTGETECFYTDASYFEGTEILNRLQILCDKKNIHFKIVDCSMGGMIPVLGLLLIDRSQNTYAFRLGAHIDPVIALERCYTETFQGVTDYSSRYFNPVDLSLSIDAPKEFNQNILNGYGKFPQSIFNLASKTFEGFKFTESCSFEEDLILYKQRIYELGFEIYIRNNSFLGFPAFHVYIPGLSDIDGRLTDMFGMISKYNSTFFHIKNDFRINHLSNTELRKYAKQLEFDAHTGITLFPYSSHPHNNLDRQLLLVMIYASLRIYDKAYCCIKKFLTGKKLSPYYYCLCDFLWLQSQNTTLEESKKILEIIYKREHVNQVQESMKNRDTVFSNLHLPNCFNCDSCPVHSHCDFIQIARFESNIREYYSRAMEQ